MIKFYYYMFGFFLLLPAVATFAFYEDYTSLLMVTTILISFVFFYLGAGFSYRVSAERVLKNSQGSRRLVWFFLLMFILTYVLMFIDFGGIPLLQYGTVDNTSSLRSEFTKSDGGLLSILTYFKSIFSKGMLPIIICWFYLNESKKLFLFILVLLTFLLLSAFEKAGLVWLFLPLFFIQIYYKNYQGFIKSLTFVVICTSMVSAVSLSHLAMHDRSRLDDRDNFHIVYANHIRFHSELETIRPLLSSDSFTDNYRKYNFEPVSIHEQEDDYQFLMTLGQKSDPFWFMVNRVVWIPFITAYDTILFWQKNYDEHLYFGVNRYLAAITGYPFANLERRVFRFQFGSGIGSTGNSNASFLSEAYIGFGYLGIALFSLLLGGIVGLFVKSNIIVFRSVIPLIYFSVLSASFISSFFSGGLFLMVVLFFLFTKRKR